MSKKSEDNLESFFRKAVNQSDSSFMEQDWQAMEKKLDENPITASSPRKRIRNTKIAVTTTAMAVLFAVYFFTLRTDQPLVGEEGSTDKQAAAGIEVPEQGDNHEKNSAAALLPSTITPDDASSDAETRTNADEMVRRSGSSGQTEIISPEHERAMPPTGLNEPAAWQPTDHDALANNELTKPEIETPENKPTPEGQPALTSEEATEKDPINQDPIGISETDALQNTHTEQRDDSKKLNRSRWNIALAIAPDFSTTSLKNYSSPGSAFGVLVGYQLHKRISINIGLMRSAKRYTGQGNEYEPPYGYWKARTNGIVPAEIYGSCRILEIPLIVQYDILQRNRSRIFAGGGISTYLMSDEEYRYNFSAPNPGADQGWSSEGAISSYPLAIGHFSLGYERQISPRVNLGIEPFLKVPFAGIGWTDIQLFTTGAFVNIRYRIGRDPGPLPDKLILK